MLCGLIVIAWSLQHVYLCLCISSPNRVGNSILVWVSSNCFGCKFIWTPLKCTMINGCIQSCWKSQRYYHAHLVHYFWHWLIGFSNIISFMLNSFFRGNIPNHWLMSYDKYTNICYKKQEAKDMEIVVFKFIL